MSLLPICSMYGLFTYIWVIFKVNVGTYSSTMEHLGYTSPIGNTPTAAFWVILSIFRSKELGTLSSPREVSAISLSYRYPIL